MSRRLLRERVTNLIQLFVRMKYEQAGRRVVAVLNTTGRARLLACAACTTIARCAVCDAAVAQPDDTTLRCSRCGTERPVVCLVCGAGAASSGGDHGSAGNRV